MKKYFILVSVLALAACGGGSGGGGGAPVAPRSVETYSTPANIRSANASVTQMETFSSNADAIVAAVSGAGIDLSTNSGTGARLASHRSASAATLTASFTNTATTRQKLAMEQLENMYKIATDDDYFAAASDKDLKNAFVLAGNNADAFDTSVDGYRATARTAIIGGYADVLDLYIDKDINDNYVFTPKINTLEDVDFMMAGERSKLVFALDEDGVITSVTKKDWKNSLSSWVDSEEGTFVRNGTGKVFNKNLTNYSFQLNNEGIDDIVKEHFNSPLSFMNTSDSLTAEQIKDALIAKVTERITKHKNSQQNDEDKAKFDTALNAYKDQINAAFAAYEANNDAVFWTTATMPMSLTVEGVKNGLKYADLGVAALTSYQEDDNGDIKSSTLYAPYVGGYTARKVEKEHIADDTEFTGTAIAGIDHKYSGDEDIEEGMLVRQNNAKLTMNHDGSSSLVMNNLVAIDDTNKGKQWYNVTINTSAAGKPTFVIDDNGKTNLADNFKLHTLVAVPEEDYKALAVDFSTGANFSSDEDRYEKSAGDDPDTDGWYTRYGGSVEANAYGPTPTEATEATSRFGFSEIRNTAGNAEQEEVAIYGVFGGKK